MAASQRGYHPDELSKRSDLQIGEIIVFCCETSSISYGYYQIHLQYCQILINVL